MPSGTRFTRVNRCSMACGRPTTIKKWDVCTPCYLWMRYWDKAGRARFTAYTQRLKITDNRVDNYFDVREPDWANSRPQRARG